MEIIKKTILQAVTTGTTACTGTTGTCYIIIPDPTAVYYFKIGLKQSVRDVGFLDAYVPPTYPLYPSYPSEFSNVPLGLFNLY
jgi:hypothetical protein